MEIIVGAGGGVRNIPWHVCVWGCTCHGTGTSIQQCFISSGCIIYKKHFLLLDPTNNSFSSYYFNYLVPYYLSIYLSMGEICLSRFCVIQFYNYSSQYNYHCRHLSFSFFAAKVLVTNIAKFKQQIKKTHYRMF